MLVQSLIVLYLSVVYGSFAFMKFYGILAVVGFLVVGSLVNFLPEAIYKYNMLILLSLSKW